MTDNKKAGNNSSAINEKLVENLIALQKIHANLAEKFDKLSGQISSLLALFETAAKDFSKQPAAIKESEKDKEFLEKIDRLLEQNKAIARGLIMVEDKLNAKPAQQMQQPMAPRTPAYQQTPPPVYQPAQPPQKAEAEEHAPPSPSFRPVSDTRPLPKF